jgi:tetratricopeptide (TPR) repeat protein
MTFWDLANGRTTDLTPIRDPSTAMAVAPPVLQAVAGTAVAIGFAYAIATGHLHYLSTEFLAARAGYRGAREGIEKGIPQALSALEEAKQKVARARIEQAIRFYERVLKARPNDCETGKQIAVSYAASGRMHDAMSAIDDVLKSVPDDHEAWLRKGTFCIALNDLEGARKAFEKATEFGPDDPESWSNLGLVYQQLGNPEKTRSCWEKVSTLKPKDFSGWLNWATLAYSLGRIEEGVKAWKEANAINPQLIPIWVTEYEFGNSAFAKGNVADASSHYDEAIRLNPAYGEPWIGKALCAKKRGDSNNALQFLDEALKRDRTNAKAWFIRGNFLAELNRAEEADASWNEAYSIDSTIRVPWVVAYDDGCNFLTSGEYQEAIRRFSKAVELYQAYTDAWFKLGVACRPLGQTEYARQCWLKVLEFNPRHALTLMNLGNLEFDDGHRDRAYELWGRAMEADQNLVQAAMNQGAALADVGELAEAAKFFSKAASAGHPLGKQALDLCRVYDEMDPSVGPIA